MNKQNVSEAAIWKPFNFRLELRAYCLVEVNLSIEDVPRSILTVECSLSLVARINGNQNYNWRHCIDQSQQPAPAAAAAPATYTQLQLSSIMSSLALAGHCPLSPADR